jgi:hypothetical protein
VPSADPRPPDPHEVLGLPASASPAEITAAYRRLARRHHPDAGGAADAARFAEAAAAYAALGQGRPGADPMRPPPVRRRGGASVPVRRVDAPVTEPDAPPGPAPDPRRLLRGVRSSWRPSPR